MLRKGSVFQPNKGVSFGGFDDDEMEEEDENEYPFDEGWKCSIF